MICSYTTTIYSTSLTHIIFIESIRYIGNILSNAILFTSKLLVPFLHGGKIAGLN